MGPARLLMLVALLAVAAPAAFAQGSIPRYTDDQLLAMCKAKAQRHSLDACRCLLKTSRAHLSAEEIGLVYWLGWDHPQNARAYIRALAKSNPAKAKDLKDRALAASQVVHERCNNVF